MSQADLSIHAQVSRSEATEVMTAPAFSVPAKKMAMWLFIIADSATFAGCLVAYGFIRNATPDWPRPFHSITNVLLMTLILLTSSLTMMFGIRHAQLGDKAEAFRWTLITAACGIMFAALHLREWFGMIGEGSHPVPQSVGHASVQFDIFQHYGAAPAPRNRRSSGAARSGVALRGGRYNADDLEITGLYWHFVDLVWMFVVPLVYLLNLSH